MTWRGCTVEEEYSKILSHELLFNEVMLHWGHAVYEEYGSFEDVEPWMRDKIIEWCRKKPYYKEYMEELDAAEAQAAAQAQAAAAGGDDEAESTFDVDTEIANLENRVTNLEAKRERMIAKKGKDGASSSKAGSSRKKNKRVVSFDLFGLVVELFSLSCFVWLSSCLV